MLGFIRSEKGGGDALLGAVADRLQAEGIRLGGVVQDDTAEAGQPCSRMELIVLDGLGRRDGRIDISQKLGAAAKGCRLNPEGLEEAVGLIASDLSRNAAGRDLVIINKFGKQEAEGDGFRPVIAQALEAGLPVLTKVSDDAAVAFADFAGDLAVELPQDLTVLLDWCRAHVARAGAEVEV